MQNNKGLLPLIISIVALCLAAFAVIQSTSAGSSAKQQQETEVAQAAQQTEVSQMEQESGDVQYVLYLGTNHKDTNEPVFAPEEAKEKAEEILLEHFGGYSIQDAKGGWIDGDTVYNEYTLVIYLSDTDIESVHAAADDMIEVFKQSSVLIHENKTKTEFYAGSDE